MKLASERSTLGFLLGFVFLVNLVPLTSVLPGWVTAIAILMLVLGMLLRVNGRGLLPGWASLSFMLVFAVLASATHQRHLARLTLATLAALTGSAAFLSPLGRKRALFVLLAAIVLVATASLEREPLFGLTFVVADVALLMLAAQSIHTPNPTRTGLVSVVLAALRLAVPVTVVILIIFEIFPSLAPRRYGRFGTTGFAGDGVLEPGEVAGLAQSTRLAFVATFPGRSPTAAELYWRGQVLTFSEGLRWLERGTGQTAQPTHASDWLSIPPEQRLIQQIRMEPGFAANLPGLDKPVAVQAAPVRVHDAGDHQFLAQTGVLRSLRIRVESDPRARERADLPPASHAALLQTPPALASSRLVQELVATRLAPQKKVSEKFAALARHFLEEGFRYTLTPGRYGFADIDGFLTRRRGFCEHYAAFSATALRLAGVPARVVTGYYGGEWNPFSRTVAVRDENAHAWVEAWSADERRWLRFDPTAAVAPERTADLERDLNSDAWPWYRLLGSLPSAAVLRFGDAGDVLENLLGDLEDALSEVDMRIIIATLALMGMILAVAQARQRGGPHDELGRAFARVRRAGALAGLPPEPGESPLAWLARCSAARPDLAPGIGAFAAEFERLRYMPGKVSRMEVRACDRLARTLARRWR